jgi:hypothetical protein
MLEEVAAKPGILIHLEEPGSPTHMVYFPGLSTLGLNAFPLILTVNSV